MNAPEMIATEQITLRHLALAVVAASVKPGASLSTEEQLLHHYHTLVLQQTGDLHSAIDQYLATPEADDAPLLTLTRHYGYTLAEILAVALVQAVEENLLISRAIAYLQSPGTTTRPTFGLLAHALQAIMPPDVNALDTLVMGHALRSGVLKPLGVESLPLIERALTIPEPIRLALNNYYSEWPGTTNSIPNIPLPDSMKQTAQQQANALFDGHTLIIRTGMPAEGRAVANLVASNLGFRPVFIDKQDAFEGLATWMLLQGRLPVLLLDLAPGERQALPTIPYYAGPLVVVTGPDGSLEDAQQARALINWSLPVPPRAEREALWRLALDAPDDPLPAELAQQHRHNSGRIAQLGRLAAHYGQLEQHPAPTRQDVLRAAREGEGLGLDALAQPLRAEVPDEALIVSDRVADQLDLLYLRCRERDQLVDNLGISATTRYHPGVRALLSGPSGTGKTLAAAWLASRLGLPLYRVDLAAITSKYIGETEKNLAQLLARAEQAEVLLLFDEADSMFGKRTEVKEANDRFANAQTNYLLQRLETFDGIALLTANNRNRLDSAFTRRLDMIVEFPLPQPPERLRLWLGHLGTDHDVSRRELNQLAANANVTGGHIRNAVLTAAVLSRSAGQPITYADILSGLEGEYRKAGEQLPQGLRR